MLPVAPLLAGYEGMALLANVLNDPEIVSREGARLLSWLDDLQPPLP
ncbi:hypothetical protein [Symbioplanes lichenis]|nr:hypothetical protein [Actinoplanes lichenis]